MQRPVLPAYAELHCRSNFSFLTGASHPSELVARAHQLGYAALAITDECSLAGVVRAHVEAQALGLHLVIGAEMRLTLSSLPPIDLGQYTAASGDAGETGVIGKVGEVGEVGKVGPGKANVGPATTSQGLVRERDAAEPLGQRLVLLAQTRRGYGNLSHWITLSRRRAEKGAYVAYASDVEGRAPSAPFLAGLPECLALLVPHAAQSFEVVLAQALWLKTWFGERAFMALELLHRAGDDELIEIVRRVSHLTDVPIVASGDVLMHVRSRKALQDTLTATRLNIPIAQCGSLLQPNAEQHLRSRLRLSTLYEPEWLARSVELAAQCRFALTSLKYEYPQELVPEGETPTSHLRTLTWIGFEARFRHARYSDEQRQRYAKTIEHELALIRQLEYEPYFLTVADIVRWARAKGILCQGRGSAANSVVCFCLEVTSVDPADASLLFERFISAERNEPPDIDIDFEHQRREEVIQYIYGKYGRHRAALTAVVITYRPRSAVRDVGRALGLDLQRIDGVAKGQQWFDGRQVSPERLRENGFDPESPLIRLWGELTHQLINFPRHLSQHPGGFVIAREQIELMVPVENAAMPNRSVIQWSKDDIEELRLIKVDILALGMLSALRRSLAYIAFKQGRPFELADVIKGDSATYDMICESDTVGVFQIESRAQMSMLPRLKPRVYYDLVVEVAIVRPGPIQGGMVHPYLRNRGLPPEEIVYPSEGIRLALERTLGVPIFQEQVMQIAINAADFTPGEADGLRRAMAAWKRKGGLGPYRERLVGRMVAKGYDPEFAESIFKQVQGFGEYGFPESHAAGFAHLAYASSWIKRHHPDAFLASLLNSQPMGFYAPAQLVRDAREHGVTVWPVDVRSSEWECTLVDVDSPYALTREDVDPPYALTREDVDPPYALTRAPLGGTTTGLAEPDPRWSLEGARGSGSTSVDSVEGMSDLHCTAPKVRWPRLSTDEPLMPVRLGLNRVSGLSEAAAKRVVEARGKAAFVDIEDLARRAQLNAHDLKALAEAEALRGLTTHRHQAAWMVAGIDTRPTEMLRETRSPEPKVELEAPTEGENTLADYRAVGLTLNRHPLALLRDQLAAFKVQTAEVLRTYPSGRLARASGIVTHRQRPDTAKGTIFITLEDETGAVNIIVWPRVAEAQRKPLLAAKLLTVYGQWQREGDVTHLIAGRLIDHTSLLGGLVARSRDFH